MIYHERMANNGMDVDPDPPTDSPALSYEMEQEKLLHLRKVTETLNNMRLQNGNNKAPPFNLNVLDTLFQMNRHLVPQPLAMMTIISLTFNYPTIPMLPLNQNCGVVTFIQSLYMVPLNTSPQMLNTLRIC